MRLKRRMVPQGVGVEEVGVAEAGEEDEEFRNKAIQVNPKKQQRHQKANVNRNMINRREHTTNPRRLEQASRKQLKKNGMNGVLGAQRMLGVKVGKMVGIIKLGCGTVLLGTMVNLVYMN